MKITTMEGLELHIGDRIEDSDGRTYKVTGLVGFIEEAPDMFWNSLSPVDRVIVAQEVSVSEKAGPQTSAASYLFSPEEVACMKLVKRNSDIAERKKEFMTARRMLLNAAKDGQWIVARTRKDSRPVIVTYEEYSMMLYELEYIDAYDNREDATRRIACINRNFN